MMSENDFRCVAASFADEQLPLCGLRDAHALKVEVFRFRLFGAFDCIDTRHIDTCGILRVDISALTVLMHLKETAGCLHWRQACLKKYILNLSAKQKTAIFRLSARI